MCLKEVVRIAKRTHPLKILAIAFVAALPGLGCDCVIFVT